MFFYIVLSDGWLLTIEIRILFILSYLTIYLIIKYFLIINFYRVYHITCVEICYSNEGQLANLLRLLHTLLLLFEDALIM